jgi:gliding motility-associated lipoprotein GldD
MNKQLVALVGLCLLLSACYNYEPYPRKLGYPRLDVPAETERSYEIFVSESCPFTFSFPSTGTITRNNPDSCWVDIDYPHFGIKWHISYRNTEVSGKSRSSHFEDYRRLIYKHTQKASRIGETAISGPTGYGTLFEIYGSVGTPAQLFFSDSTGQQIAMMSMYYQTALKNDSLMPITNYMKEELAHMVNTLQWN